MSGTATVFAGLALLFMAEVWWLAYRILQSVTQSWETVARVQSRQMSDLLQVLNRLEGAAHGTPSPYWPPSPPREQR